jgi:hypothetical protein
MQGTSRPVIPVPLFDLKFLIALAAYGAGTSNRRYWAHDPPKHTIKLDSKESAVWREDHALLSNLELDRTQRLPRGALWPCGAS